MAAAVALVAAVLKGCAAIPLAALARPCSISAAV